MAGPEVEDALFTHPAVAECAVVGLLDAERGMLIKAFGCSSRSSPASNSLVKALQDHVKATLAPFKYPRQIEFVAMLPRT